MTVVRTQSYLFADNIDGVHDELHNCSLRRFELRNDDTMNRIPSSSAILYCESDSAELTRTVELGFSKRTNSNRVRLSKKSDAPSLDTCFVTENNRFVLRKVVEYSVVSTPSLCVCVCARSRISINCSIFVTTELVLYNNNGTRPIHALRLWVLFKKILRRGAD